MGGDRSGVGVTCHMSYAFEVGQGIDLAACERLLSSATRQTVRAGRRVPPGFEYRPAPIRIDQEKLPRGPGGLGSSYAEAVLYDFGAVSVNFGFRYEGPIGGLPAVSVALQGDEAGLGGEARRRATALIATLGGAVTRPAIGPTTEDYLVFQFDWSPTAAALSSGNEAILAGILRGATACLSDQEIEAAVSGRLRYREDDVTLIDWNAAIVIDSEPEDTRTVLEFANVQLLEFRHLDGELDLAVERAYEALGRAERSMIRRFYPPLQAFRHLAMLQMDAAALFERVSNGLKVVGDQFLSLVYQTASARFHLSDWDRGIARKLEVLEGIYQKIGDQVSARRLELLEWIVILLIALELVLG